MSDLVSHGDRLSPEPAEWVYNICVGEDMPPALRKPYKDAKIRSCAFGCGKLCS
jgi:hypothetical protein